MHALCGWGCMSGWAHAGTYMYMGVHVCGSQKLVSALLLSPFPLYFSASWFLTESTEQDWQKAQRSSCLCFCSPGTTDTPLPMTRMLKSELRLPCLSNNLSTNKSHLSGHRHMLLHGIDYSGDFIGNIPNISHLLEFLCYEPFGRKKSPLSMLETSCCRWVNTQAQNALHLDDQGWSLEFISWKIFQ